MRKILLLLVAVIYSMTTFAQSSHMKFMGIPLNVSITDFSSKLTQKGATVSPVNENLHTPNCKMFKGSFFDYEADIFVYFNMKSKIVYRAKAVIKTKTLKEALNDVTPIISVIKSKYNIIDMQDKSDENIILHSFHISANEKEADNNEIGSIDIYTIQVDPSVEDDYYLHIDYIDKANYNLNTKAKEEDI